ncbi:MAG: efflux RND transporter permease subunit [Planctomycetota bacterium]
MEHAAVVLLLAGLLLAAAIYRLPHTAVDVFPELAAPTVVVMSEAPGLAADEVEQYVTFPIETAVHGIPGVRRVRTSSAIGLSIAYVEFEWGQNIYLARQLVSERLDSVREDLPRGTHAEMTPITSITGEIMLLAVSSPDGSVSPMDLRSWCEFDLRKRILAVAGIAQVSVIGGELPEYRVQVDSDVLHLHGLTMQDVADAADNAHSALSAGYLADVDHQELPVRQSGRIQSVEDIAGTLVRIEGGAPLTIAQVAEVELAAAPRRGTGSDGGHPAVILTLQKAPGTNTLAVTQKVDELLDRLTPSVPAGIEINRQVFRQSDFIRLSVENVTAALRDAALIVAVILALFLMNFRTTVVTLTALPLSLAAGILALDALGETINVMTLGGLAIAVGSLVDDAIIDVENVFRRLRLNALLPPEERLSKARVIVRASNEIRPAMVFATIIIALVFLPLMFLGGIEGRFFRPLGIAFVVSLLASLFVALTVTPALCRVLLPAAPRGHGEGDGLAARLLKKLYRPTLRWALRLRYALLAGATLATAACLWLATTFGSSFLPEFNEGTFTVGLFAPPGTSLTASDRMGSAMEQRLLEIEGIRSVTRRTGRAERDEHAEPVSNSELEVTLLPGYRKADLLRQVTAVLEDVPGITTNVGQPIEHRLSHILSGTPAAIAISVYGEDLDQLRSLAKRMEAILKEIPGTRDVTANREVLAPSLPVHFRPQNLAAYGLTPRTAAQQVRDAVFGIPVAEVHAGLRTTELVVRLRSEQRDEIEDLRHLILHGVDGSQVRLEDVADLGPELASNLITRENSQRKAVVSLNVAEGANLGHLVAEVKAQIDPLVHAAGYEVHYGGQFEAQQSASRTLAGLGGLALVFMVLLLYLAIGSLRVTLLVLVNLPMALIGGVLAIFITQSPDVLGNLRALLEHGAYRAPVLSIASLVGFTTLFGIAVRNGILLVNHYRHLMEEEGCDLQEAILRGSVERIVPILMTALTAALALLPIVWKGEQPGNEILSPLSVVILGGLLTSTFLNLILVPAGYAALHRWRAGGPRMPQLPSNQ